MKTPAEIDDVYPCDAMKVVEARPLAPYRVWVRFADGTEGVDDLSHLAGSGVFDQWEEPGVWEGLRIVHDSLGWGSEDPTEVVDIAPEPLYLRVAGITWNEFQSKEYRRRVLRRLGQS